MADKTGDLLKSIDRDLLRGYDDIERDEPPQLDPIYLRDPEEEVSSSSERLRNTRSLALEVLANIDRLKQKVDNRCQNLSVDTQEIKGSRLFQAMVRVFNERTTVVTYEHYKKALKLRDQLAREDSDRIRLS